MERLTQWNGEKYILPQGRTSDGESYWRIIADRLAAYENTGMMPSEIASIKGNIIDKLDRIEQKLDQTKQVPLLGAALSVATVAEKLGVTKHTVYAWTRSGALRSVRTGGRVLIPDTALKEFLERRE